MKISGSAVAWHQALCRRNWKTAHKYSNQKWKTTVLEKTNKTEQKMKTPFSTPLLYSIQMPPHGRADVGNVFWPDTAAATKPGCSTIHPFTDILTRTFRCRIYVWPSTQQKQLYICLMFHSMQHISLFRKCPLSALMLMAGWQEGDLSS